MEKFDENPGQDSGKKLPTPSIDTLPVLYRVTEQLIWV